jgi:hypothetical protein
VAWVKELFQTSSLPNLAMLWEVKKTKYVLSEFALISGTNYLSATVSTEDSGKWRGEADSASSYGDSKHKKDGYTPVNNYIFVNRQDLSSRKLFLHNKFVILDDQEIGEVMKEGAEGDKKAIVKNVTAILYRVVKADTNNDKLLDAHDQNTIALADANGGNYQELVTGIDRVINIHAQSKDRHVVFYQTGQNYFVASIDIPRKSVKVNKLPSIAE